MLGQGDSGLEWQTPDTYSVSSESLSVTPTTADGNTEYKVELTSVSTDLLAQGNDVLIFDCGDSGVTTVTE